MREQAARCLTAMDVLPAHAAKADSALAVALMESSFLDPEYYLWLYPDVELAEADPCLHYVQCGYRELRSPAAWLDAEIIARIAASQPVLRKAGFREFMEILRNLPDERIPYSPDAIEKS